MKTAETKTIEYVLWKNCFGANPKLAKEYGTSEVTISIPKQGKELVDFISYDTKNNIFRCYEIKISLSDLRSKAKKSWYGNYNYLVISHLLKDKLSKEAWIQEVPPHVGIIVINTETQYKFTLKKASHVSITEEAIQLLKNSMLRSMFYKIKRGD